MKIDEETSNFYQISNFDQIASVSSFTVVSIDSEFRDDFFLTLQIHIPSLDEKIVVINSQLEDYLPEKKNIIDGLAEEYLQTGLCTKVCFEPLDDPIAENLPFILEDVFTSAGKNMPKNILLLFFFAVRDLYPAFGYENLKSSFGPPRKYAKYNTQIFNLRNLKGHIYTGKTDYRLFDLSGMASFSSLKTLADSLSIPLLSKDSLLPYKENMAEPMLSDDLKLRQLFLEYSMDDATVLFNIYNTRINQYNLMIQKCFNFKNHHLISPKEFPSTVGTLVSMTFDRYIQHRASEKLNLIKFNLAMIKIGYIDPGLKNIMEVREQRAKFLDDPNKSLLENPKEVEKHCSSKNYIFSAMSLGSIPFLKTYDRKTNISSALNVTGGRIVNERYKEFLINDVMDFDIVSCYSNSLALMEYPIGKPRVYASSINSFGPTLARFLDEHKGELLDNFYQIVVTGKLSFKQDLIFSKVIGSQTLTNFIKQESAEWSFNEETVHAEHLMLQKEIVNGILTSHLLNLIKLLSTNLELHEFMNNMRVQSAIYYSKKDRINGLEKWADVILNDSQETEGIFHWTSLPIKEFVTPVSEQRSYYKKLAKTTQNPDEKSRCMAFQTGLKLLNNTLYGCLASPFFPIGNVCVANNITAFARAESYLYAKVLKVTQILTDGGIWSPTSILRLKTEMANFKKPGLNTLSSIYTLEASKNVEEVTLDGKNWNQIFRSDLINKLDYNEIANSVKKHVQQFWQTYQIQLIFEVEMKANHTGIRACFFGKGHYAIKKIDGNYEYKLRGFKPLSHCGKVTPIFGIFNSILNLNFKIPSDLGHLKKTLLTITEWKIKSRADPKYKLKPGDSYIKPVSILRFNNLHFPLMDAKESISRKRKWSRKNTLSFHLKHKIEDFKLMVKKMTEDFEKK